MISQSSGGNLDSMGLEAVFIVISTRLRKSKHVRRTAGGLCGSQSEREADVREIENLQSARRLSAVAFIKAGTLPCTELGTHLHT